MPSLRPMRPMRRDIALDLDLNVDARRQIDNLVAEVREILEV